MLLCLLMPIDGALLISRQIAGVDRNLFLCGMILDEAHVLQRFVFWLGIADLTRSPASTGTGMVVDGSFDIFRVEHYLTFPAMEHLGIWTVQEAILGPVDNVLVSLSARCSEFCFDTVARNVSLADWLR